MKLIRFLQTSSIFVFITLPATAMPITPERQFVINQLEFNRKREASRWRQFGSVWYDWKSWKRNPSGIHTTTAKTYGGGIVWKVAATCSALKVSRTIDGKWTEWKLPDTYQEQMLIELCSQIPDAPKAVVRPESFQKYKPASSDCLSRISCATQL